MLIPKGFDFHEAKHTLSIMSSIVKLMREASSIHVMLWTSTLFQLVDVGLHLHEAHINHLITLVNEVDEIHKLLNIGKLSITPSVW